MRAIEILRNFPVEKWPHLKSGNRLPGKTACFSVKPSCRRGFIPVRVCDPAHTDPPAWAVDQYGLLIPDIFGFAPGSAF
jgi:hypothetical protein